MIYLYIRNGLSYQEHTLFIFNANAMGIDVGQGVFSMTELVRYIYII